MYFPGYPSAHRISSLVRGNFSIAEFCMTKSCYGGNAMTIWKYTSSWETSRLLTTFKEKEVSINSLKKFQQKESLFTAWESKSSLVVLWTDWGIPSLLTATHAHVRMFRVIKNKIFIKIFRKMLSKWQTGWTVCLLMWEKFRFLQKTGWKNIQK